MDIKKATSVKMITPTYGFAIYETDWQGNPCKPVVHFLIKNTRKDGSIWYQQTPGWYAETLLEKQPSCPDIEDETTPGLYIDVGQDWFIPIGPYSLMWDWIDEYVRSGARWLEKDVIDTISKSKYC